MRTRDILKQIPKMLEVPKSFKNIAGTVGHVQSKSEAQDCIKVVKDTLQAGDYFVCMILREPKKTAIQKLASKPKTASKPTKPATKAPKKK